MKEENSVIIEGLNEGDEAVGLGLKNLGNECTEFKAQLVALDLIASAEWITDNSVEGFSGNSDFLLSLGQGHEADVLLDVVKEHAINDGEKQVGGTWNGISSCLQLLDLDGVLASDLLVRELND